ncbi:ATP-binding protein [Synechocystis sp. PCC 7509]|uniref:ATP-binding protein n=1 Tax=Synechocystis sp. PCC 7509 TaxID=927677 RepID=UPI0002AC66F4|nr:ATP-binding protein [Synechocystis sp. PCC 7509]
MAINRLNQTLATRLPRSLSATETWGFGLTGHVGWIGTAPIIHAALGPKAIFVWLPGIIVSVMLNIQVQQLGMHWSDVAGGTPNYAARLLKNFYGLDRYVAIGYFVGWVAAPAIYAIVLTDLIKVNIEPIGITCPEVILKVGFLALAFIVGLSGTRALGILHLFFVVPAIGLLLVFCVQGLGWLAFSTNSPGFFPTNWSSLSFAEWAKWFFISTISVYSCETASSFVADSRSPGKTLRCLSWSAWLIPPVFLGGSLVLMQLATKPGMGDNLYLNLLTAARPFWGQSASFLVTLLIAFCCLLSCATAVANTSRILFQLALDGQLAPVFTVISRKGVLEPALIFSFILSLLCLVWGDIHHVVMVAGTSYLISIMGLHLGLWLRRKEAQVLFPHWAIAFFIVEAVVLVVGGLAWGWQYLLLGLALPIFILMGDRLLRRVPFAPFHPSWWQRHYHAKPSSKNQDFVMLQVFVLVCLICSSTAIGWAINGRLDRTSSESSGALLAVVLVTLSFVGIGIACWTTLPQISAIDEARQQAKNLLIAALDTVPDTILVLDQKGTICQANPASKELFQINVQDLLGYNLNTFFSNLAGRPEQWLNHSEHTLENSQGLRIVELTISRPSSLNNQEYVAIVRDITKRKQSEVEIRDALAKEKELGLLKSRFVTMTSHEFRTPLTTILSSAELLELYSFKWNEDKKIKHLQRIQIAVKQMINLLNDVLLIGKSEAGKLEYNPAPLDLIQFCYDLVEEIQITTKSHNITFVSKINCSHINPDNCRMAYLDDKLLRHILSNLLSNAIKYSPEGDSVNFELIFQQGEAIFHITDRGIGIPIADREQLFNSFHRASNVGTISGTGLGLAIVKRSADLHGGKIAVSSEVGIGTTFTVSLPLRKQV